MAVSNLTDGLGLPGHIKLATNARAQLQEADDLRQCGELDRAEASCVELIRRYPDYVAAFHTLALVYLDKQIYERALDCLLRAQMRDPENWLVLVALGLAYAKLGVTEMAVQTLNRALAIRSDASVFAALGEAYRNDNEYEVAEDWYRKALALDQGMESSIIGLALSQTALCKYDEAATTLQAALKRGHRSLNLLHVVAALPRHKMNIEVLKILESLAADWSRIDAESKNTFLFVRAGALHGAGRYAEAWQELEKANEPLSDKMKAQIDEDTARQRQCLSRLRDGSLKPVAYDHTPVTLLILGPSRSGKSSLEYLLRSLQGVKAGFETPIVEKALFRTLQAVALPGIRHLEDVPPEYLVAFREQYSHELSKRMKSARVFTNTLASRIYDADLITSVVPNVRIVLMRRNPQDVALRIYMSKYLRGNTYAYDVGKIADYLAWYDETMGLLAEKFPGVTLDISYEAMIANPTATISKVASFVGLRADDAPLPNLVDDRDVAKPYSQMLDRYLVHARDSARAK
jgi:tetratricopeptide (TPR) repeat protein